jgi:hypothetical protein
MKPALAKISMQDLQNTRHFNFSALEIYATVPASIRCLRVSKQIQTACPTLTRSLAPTRFVA